MKFFRKINKKKNKIFYKKLNQRSFVDRKFNKKNYIKTRILKIFRKLKKKVKWLVSDRVEYSVLDQAKKLVSANIRFSAEYRNRNFLYEKI